MKFQYAVKTGKGLIRANNEDNFYVDHVTKPQEQDEMFFVGETMEKNPVFVVSDGMGGEEAGEVASFITVSEVENCWRGDPVAFVREINRAVLQEAEKLGTNRMGSTISFLSAENDRMILGNVGDSRNYRFHEGFLQRTSKDHSKAQMLMDMGLMEEEEAKKSEAWHILVQNLGLLEEEALLVPYVEEYAFEVGDLYLLCSDGLSDLVSEELLCEVLAKTTTLEEKVMECYQLAISAGGRDNITIMMIRCEE